MSDIATLSALRRRIVGNHVRYFCSHSLLKIAVVVLFGVAFWGGMFALFYEAFSYLNENPDIKSILVDILFALFFMSLLLMLTFSNGIISFTSLFRSDETAYLFTRPMRPGSVFAYKLFEGLVFSSWAFLFLGMPLIFAYGFSSNVRWYFYPGAVAFFGTFVFIPAGVGAAVTLVIGRWFANSPKRILALVAGTTLFTVMLWGTGLLHDMRAGLSRAPEMWMRNILGRVVWCRNPLFPSRWVSSGLLAMVDGELGDTLFYFLLILSNALFIMMIAYWLASRWYQRAYHTLADASRRGRQYGDTLFDRALMRALWPLRLEMRLLIIKDVKTFRRDPVQWSQVLIFFGILGVYLLNMRRLHYNITGQTWKTAISFLNLAATSLTLCTFTSRFVYPLLSLEGRRFWVLGLLPMQRRAVLTGKFLFAFGGSLIISEGLMLLSDFMLSVSWPMALLHCFAMFIICAGLSGISVGMGALFPNLREDNPSKIVSGFGGTLNLLTSMAFVFLVIALIAEPCHVYLVRHAISTQAFTWQIIRALVLVALVGVLACVVPLALGRRAFERIEV